MSEDELEVLDVENYKGGKDQQFSHQFLVMKVISRCIETGTKEMRSGYWNEKVDKFGNKVATYIPDTRKEFIESVKIAEMIMLCDFDDEAIKEIAKIKSWLDEELNHIISTEKKDWDNCSATIKRMRWEKGIFFQEGSLSIHLPYYQDYIEVEITAYRKILGELNKLTKRLGFYEEEAWEV